MPTTMFDPRMKVAGVDVILGEFTKAEVDQVGTVPGTVSNRVIDPTQPFNIEIEWTLGGNIAFVNPTLNAISPPVWRIYVYAEKMGPGQDLRIYTGTEPGAVPVPVNQFPPSWSHTCNIPANTLPEQEPAPAGQPQESGMYRLCIVVWANTNVPGGQDIVGCHEGPMILAENPA